MNKLTEIQIQARVLRTEVRAAHEALRAHERKARRLRQSLRRCERSLKILRTLLLT
jgi:hypothetical protein